MTSASVSRRRNSSSESEQTPEALRVQEKRQKNTEYRQRNRLLEKFRIANARSDVLSSDSSEFLNSTLANRAAALHARRAAFKLSEETSGKGLEYQKAFMSKLLEQPVLQFVLPDYVVHKKDYEHCRVVCDGLTEAWSGLKYGLGKDKMLARNVIEAAVISLDDERCLRAAARSIGMNKRTVHRAKLRRNLLNRRSVGEVWAKIDRKKRVDTLDQSVIDLVIAWWTDETRVSPCKNDVRKKRIAVKKRISHATHWLEESQLDFYGRFKAAHEQVQVSFTSFRRLKPFFVKRLTDFNSCCCRYCTEMFEITVGFNNMRATRVHLQQGTSTCDCGCLGLCLNLFRGDAPMGPVNCQATAHVYKRSTHLWEQSLCPKPEESEWHSLQCIKRECRNCGFHQIPICERELDPVSQSIMTWRRFEMVVAGKNKKGEPKTVIRLEYKVTTPRFFLAFAKPKIEQFVLHQFVHKWQDHEFKASSANLKEGEVMSLIDFAENYSFKGQDEIQSQHWFNFQLSILVHITYIVNTEYNPSDLKSKRLKTDYHYYISDDRLHDSLFVQHCLTLHWHWMVASGMIPNRHLVWSDGCSAQFKGAKTWFYVAKYPSLTVSDDLPRGCKMDWNFWGTGHSKGPHDGAGACLKQTLKKEQLKPTGTRLQNAEDVVNFLKVAMNLPNAAYPGARRVVDRHFHLIGPTDVSRIKPLACNTVSGSRSMHSIRSVSHTTNVLLECREFSYFCCACARGGSGECPNSAHVSPWKLVTLDPITSTDVIQEPEESDPDWVALPDDNNLAKDLEIGDHFAVVADSAAANSNGAKFFVLICTKTMYTASTSMRDNWNTVIDVGDEVVEGIFYQQQGRKSNSYIKLDAAGVVRVFSHLVIATNFVMTLSAHKQKGNTSVYKLSEQALTHIDEVLQSRLQHEELESEDEDGDDELMSDSEESSFEQGSDCND